MQQKLKSNTFEKIMQSALTSSELNVLVYLSHFQNDVGTIIGVYYKDICETLKISYQTFYDVLKNLSEKGIISYKKNNYYDWDITILDNDFSYETAVDEGYISMGHDIFSSPDFFSLKAPEKLLAMYIMRTSGAGTRRYCISVDKFHEKFENIFGVTKRVLRGYTKRLKKFFSIGIKDGIIWVTVRKIAKKNNSMTDKEAYAWSVCKALFRRNRVKMAENTQTFKEMTELIEQYAGGYKDKIAEYIMNATRHSLQIRNAGRKSEYKWNRKIAPRHVHYLLKEELQ